MNYEKLSVKELKSVSGGGIANYTPWGIIAGIGKSAYDNKKSIKKGLSDGVDEQQRRQS